MRLVSDKVTSDTITAVTDTCNRDDCRLSAEIEVTTLVANSCHYNKNGILVVNDRNSRTTQVECGSCWKCFRVHHDHGIVHNVTDITEELEAEWKRMP